MVKNVVELEKGVIIEIDGMERRGIVPVEVAARARTLQVKGNLPFDDFNVSR